MNKIMVDILQFSIVFICVFYMARYYRKKLDYLNQKINTLNDRINELSKRR